MRHRVVPVYDYVLMTEPLTDAQWRDLGWADREGLSDSGNQFHYYRPTEDGRILWGGYDAVYHSGNGFGPQFENDDEPTNVWPRTSCRPSRNLKDIRFTHAWGGAIDTCSRFTAFWGTEAGARSPTLLASRDWEWAQPLRRQVTLDLLDGHDTARTRLEMVRVQAASVPSRTVAYARHQMDHHVLAACRRQGRPAQPVAAHPWTG